MYVEASQKAHPFNFSWLHSLQSLFFLHIKIILSIYKFIHILFQPQSQLQPQPQLESFKISMITYRETNPNQQKPWLGDAELSREDVKTVMERLGMSSSPEEGESMSRCLGMADISLLFADVEPSLEEVQEAFRVFDENRDGFIDAEELQRVLFKLGFGEASNAALCNMMIAAFDENSDGRIDFKEFVKLIEKDFC